MPLSRLRLRLAAWFALAFLVGLTALDTTLYLYLGRQNDHRLTRSLQRTSAEAAQAVQIEYADDPGGGLPGAVQHALVEWPSRPEAVAIYAADGGRIGSAGESVLLSAAPERLPSDLKRLRNLVGPGEQRLRAVTSRSSGQPDFVVLALRSTLTLDEENEALAAWFAFSTPVAVVLSLIGGYILSRRALRPIAALADDVAKITPSELDRRLAVHSVPDELDRLAEQFNALLERLQRAQAQNRRFLQQAAHQIKTPLTLVLGEADLSLDRPRTAAEQHAALQRIRTAAEQMKRRVDELFLLAQTEAGERVNLTETVELDGLVLECADLMRGRAQALGRRLELLRVEPVSIRGNEPLLREAVLELVENACRYGSSDSPITVSAFSTGTAGCVLVASAGEPVTSSPAGGASSDAAGGAYGLGLAIVRWIASAHSGSMTYQREAGVNVYGLLLPAISLAGERVEVLSS